MPGLWRKIASLDSSCFHHYKQHGRAMGGHSGLWERLGYDTTARSKATCRPARQKGWSNDVGATTQPAKVQLEV